jgi:hypothetical protein
MTLLLPILEGLWKYKAWLLAALIAAVVYFQHLDIKRLDHDVAAAKATIKAMNAAGERQAAATKIINADNQRKANALQTQLDSALKAHAITGAALSDSVRKYEALRRGSSVPCRSSPAGEDPRSSADAAREQRYQRIDAALADVPAACQLVIDQLGACQTWAKSVSCSAKPAPAR